MLKHRSYAVLIETKKTARVVTTAVTKNSILGAEDGGTIGDSDTGAAVGSGGPGEPVGVGTAPSAVKTQDPSQSTDPEIISTLKSFLLLSSPPKFATEVGPDWRVPRLKFEPNSQVTEGEPRQSKLPGPS
mmetsp:Transcript_6971/g.11034  ORF Transcript_6971/g.11034 Transcript_6971/m.11034 type:complete len:130 (-) Transcript_6971:86-475(-)